MLLRQFRARNYKSLRETPLLEFDAGINVIVGQNNVGKTALLEALSGRATDTRHRNLTAFRSEAEPNNVEISFDVAFDIERDELRAFCRHYSPEVLVVFVGSVQPGFERRVHALFERRTIRVEGIVTLNQGVCAHKQVDFAALQNVFQFRFRARVPAAG